MTIQLNYTSSSVQLNQTADTTQAMATFLPLNSYHSLSLTPITFQRRNSNCNSLKINKTHHVSSSSFPTPSKPLPHCTLVVRSSEEDSNPETLPDGEVNNLGVKIALSMLKFYKKEISPILPRSCRYIPTCSEYSMEAYKRYGVLKGTVLTTWRLCRCNPLGGYGYDPPRWFGEIRHEEEVDD